MQIETKMRYYLTSVRVTFIKNKKKKRDICWRKGILVHCRWECKMYSHSGKHCRGATKKLKIELRSDPVNLLLGIYPKELKAGP